MSGQQPPGGDVTPKGPQPKKRCDKKTPQKVVTSTPTRQRARSLNFALSEPSNEDEMCWVQVKMPSLAQPFMKRSFVTKLEKMRIRCGISPELESAVVDCANFDKKSRSVKIKFANEGIATKMRAINANKYMNTTMTFEQVVPLRIPSPILNNEEMYLETTIINDDLQDEASSNHGGSDSGLLLSPVQDKASSNHGGSDSGGPNDSQHEEASYHSPVRMFSPTPKDKMPHVSKVDTANEEGTNKVMVTELPSDYLESELAYEIHKALWTKTDIKKPKKPIVSVKRVEKPDVNEAIVTFDSIYAAETAASLKSVEIGGEDHRAKLTQIFNQVQGSERVAVTKLPLNFCENELVYEIHKALWASTKIKKPNKPVVNVIKTGPHEAVVTFESKYAASTAASMGTVEFELDPVKLELIYEKAPEVTNKLIVKELPMNFCENELVYEIHKALWASTEIKRPNKPVVNIVKTGPHEAVVTFESTYAACMAASMGTVELELVPVKLEHFYDVRQDDSTRPFSKTLPLQPETSDADVGPETSDADSGFSTEENLLKHSTWIKIDNIPIPVDEDDLKKFLIRKMDTAGFLYDANEEVFLSSKIDSGKNCAYFNACGSEEAHLATLLENVVFNKHRLDISKCVMDENFTLKLESSASAKSVPLDSDEGITEFLKQLIKYRDDFPTSGSIEHALGEVRKALSKKHIYASLAEVRKKRKHLKDAHNLRERNGVKKHKLRDACLAAFYHGPTSVLEGTPFALNADDGNDNNDNDNNDNDYEKDLAEFSECKTWTTKAIRALIATCIEKKAQFHEVLNRKKFWRDIATLMGQQKHKYSDVRCRKKMDTFVASYKNIQQKLNGTGSQSLSELLKDSPLKDHFLDMDDLMEGDVSVKPRVTSSVGARTSRVQEEPGPSRGRMRPSVLKRNPTTAERKVAAQEMRAQALLLLAKNTNPSNHARRPMVVAENDEDNYDEDDY